MVTNERILYSINVEDAQTVAEEKLGRKLTDEEIALVEDKLGDYIDWHYALQCALSDSIQVVA